MKQKGGNYFKAHCAYCFFYETLTETTFLNEHGLFTVHSDQTCEVAHKEISIHQNKKENLHQLSLTLAEQGYAHPKLVLALMELC